MASTPARLMTFAEFERLPETPQGFPYELRHGELVQMPPRSFPRVRAQERLCELLRPLAGSANVVQIEVPFRATPDHEYRQADVAMVSRSRWDSAGQYLFGAPELVIEILSPSNTKAEMSERAKLCLENGSREFWVVDLDRKQVTVLKLDGSAVSRGPGQHIPLFFVEAQNLAVEQIFS